MALLKIRVFWDVTLCQLLHRYNLSKDRSVLILWINQ